MENAGDTGVLISRNSTVLVSNAAVNYLFYSFSLPLSGAFHAQPMSTVLRS